MCAKAEGGDELSKILLANKAMPVEIALYYSRGKGHGGLAWAWVLAIQSGECGYTEIPRGVLGILAVEISYRMGNTTTNVTSASEDTGSPAALGSSADIPAIAVAVGMAAISLIVMRRLRRPRRS